ncbi:MAG: hypothetical protein ACKV0T_22845, partial [Planctomycetales bacterium]
DWETYFLIGRSYVEREKDLPKAAKNLEAALKIKPDLQCAEVWLARVQTTARHKEVRDLDAGIDSLEKLWKRSDKQAWRIGQFLAEAYEAAGRGDEAEALLKEVEPLVPREVRERGGTQRRR